MAGALDGLLVVAIEQAVAAPYCTSRLADAGARIIKIERPEGDFARRYDKHVHGQSTYFVWLNRGKESACLDLKNDADRAILAGMIARADILVQNLAPGALARLGFTAADLRQKYPALILCEISGYGDTGPYADMKAYDLLVQAESGLCSVTGNVDAPARVGVSVCDIAAGMYAHAAILEALIARGQNRSGPLHQGFTLRRHGRLDECAISPAPLWRPASAAPRFETSLHRAIRRVCLQRRRYSPVDSE